MICLGQGGLRSLSASSLGFYWTSYILVSILSLVEVYIQQPKIYPFTIRNPLHLWRFLNMKEHNTLCWFSLTMSQRKHAHFGIV